MWTEALNQAGVDASSAFRRAKNVFYLSALRVAGPSNSRDEIAPKAPMSNQADPASALPTPTIPSKEADQTGTMDKGKEQAKEKALQLAKLALVPKETSKEKGASQGQVLILATLPFTTKEDPKSKGIAQATVPEAST